MLFDPGSTYSYISTYFTSGFDLLYDRVPVPVHVSTPIGKLLLVDRV